MSETNGYVTRDQMIAPTERATKDIEVPGLGKVQIQTITELERSRMEAPNYTKRGTVNVEKLGDARCRLVVAGVANPRLTNNDVQYLRNKDSRIINYLADEIAKHCGITAADMEDIEKNSETPAAASQ